MKYIKYVAGKLICTHPKVDTVWQVGMDSRVYQTDNSSFTTKTNLLMKDGERKEFVDLKENFDEAEKYLQTI